MDEMMNEKEAPDMDEIELALRRFASNNNNRPLSKLLDSLFTQPISEDEPGETEDGQED